MQHTYFVYYAYTKTGKYGGGEGNTEISLDTPLTTLNQIRGVETEIQKRLQKHSGRVVILSVMVRNYILLRSE